METPWAARFAQRTQQMQSSAIREILKITQLPEVISFAGGLPSPDVFPVEELIEACTKVLHEQGPDSLQYSTTEGYLPLRKMICQHTSRYGIKVDPENVLITTGSQQALDLIGKIFINPGDKILVEAPTYIGAIQAWKAYGAEFIQVEMDENGMIPESMEKALRTGPKFIYVLPNFQNPTGITLSKERREQIIALGDRYGVPIVEDDPYGQLRYEGEHIPPVVVLDSKKKGYENGKYNGNVIYLSTFSKTLAPGLRLAWVIAPEEVIYRLVQAKQGADLHTPTFNQMIAHEVSQHGFLDSHIERIREVYGKRRNIMLDMIDELFPKEAQFTRPHGGLFLWGSLPEWINTTELLPIAVEKKVAYVPGSPFFPNGGGENTLRLNFSNASDEEIMTGMSRLGEVFKAAIKNHK
jgi:2-aminoadipate transaminase